MNDYLRKIISYIIVFGLAGNNCVSAAVQKTDALASRSMFSRSAAEGRIVSAKYAEVPEAMREGCYGWLWTTGIEGLEGYADGEEDVSLRKEKDNARRIRNKIETEGVGRDLEVGELLNDFGRRNIIVWDGREDDEKLNFFIERNIIRVLKNMGEDERSELIKGLKKYTPPFGVVVAVLARSRHWSENCRGDGFIGINRRLLEKIEEVFAALEAEDDDGERERLEERLTVLEAYLQTYLYHELRHEAHIVERKILAETAYAKEARMKIDSEDLPYHIETMEPKKKVEFAEELERRQNGVDARLFARLAGENCERWLGILIDTGIVERDSLFVEAAAIVGFAPEAKDDWGDDKHHNQLVIRDFTGIGRGRIPQEVFKKYAAAYDTKLHVKEHRGKISFMLYQLGLNDHIRVRDWRQAGEFKKYDKGQAKAYVLRLIDFVAKNERYIEYSKGRKEISKFRKRRRPITHKEAARLLTVTLLASGDYSRAVLRSELAFLTSGIINTITGNKIAFWKFIEEACAERVKMGDERFSGITAEDMRAASVEREFLPRLRILRLFKSYLAGDRLKRVNRKPLSSLCGRYGYLRDGTFDVTDDEIAKFDRLYKDAIDVLRKLFEVEGEEWDEYLDDENDILKMLWDAFDLVENLAPERNYAFTEEMQITAEERGAMSKLKEAFDKEDNIKIRDIISAENKRYVQLILRMYKAKVLLYRGHMSEILRRHGTERELNGYRVWDIVSETRSWRAGQWLAREYSDLFRHGKMGTVYELDAGLSTVYRALKMTGVKEERLAGLTDVISVPAMEYFGDNPKRVTRDMCTGGVRDLETGEQIEIKAESSRLVLSSYKLHQITSSRKLFDLFKEVNRILEFGGQFALTMPPTRRFSEEALEMLRSEMGFETELTPGVLIAGTDTGAKATSFYVAVFRKVDKVKDDVHDKVNRALLIPAVVQERGAGAVVALAAGGAAGGFDGLAAGPRSGARGASAGSFTRLGGERYEQGLLGTALEDGIGHSDEIRQRAENRELFEMTQEIIGELWEEVVCEPDGLRVKDFAGRAMSAKVGGVLDYAGEHTDEDVEAVEKLCSGIEKLKAFVFTNIEEFLRALAEIEEKKEVAKKLTGEVKRKYGKVSKYNKTDLTQSALTDVRGVLRALRASEKEIGEEAAGEKARRAFADENYERFAAMKKLIKKYQILAGDKNQRRDIRKVLNTGKDALTEALMMTAVQVDGRLAQALSGAKKQFASLREFEDAAARIMERVDFDFLFTRAEIGFLNQAKSELEKDEVEKAGIFGKHRDSNMEQLTSCMTILEEWEDRKGSIDANKGLAVLLDIEREEEYLAALENELLDRPVMAEKGTAGKLVAVKTELSSRELKEILKGERGGIAVGETLVIAIDDGLNYSEAFYGHLEKMGFRINAFYETHLELKPEKQIENKTEIEQFIRFGKRIIVVEKVAETNEGGVVVLNIDAKEDGRKEDYEGRVERRLRALQDIAAEDVSLCVEEYLSDVQIRRLYPDWAKASLGKGKWAGGLFSKSAVQSAAAAFEKKKKGDDARREEEGARQRERAEKLIKMSKTPVVEITYGGVWTEALVGDLAHILLKLVGDFDDPPDAEEIIENTLIKNHPQLKNISGEDLIGKIAELIEFRQYYLKLEQAYRECGRFMISILPYKVISNFYFKTNEKQRIWDSVLIHDRRSKKEMLFHNFSLGVDQSPFGSGSMEYYYADVIGRVIDLRCIASSRKIMGEWPLLDAKGYEVVFHNLFDPGCGQEIFAGLTGVVIYSGAHLYYQQILRETKGASDGTAEYEGDLRNFEQTYRRVMEFAELFKAICENRNVENEYLEDLKYYMCKYKYMMSVGKPCEPEEVSEMFDYIIDGFTRFFKGNMTTEEYSEFKGKLRETIEDRISINVELGTVSMPIAGVAHAVNMKNILSRDEIVSVADGQELFYYYVHGDGRNMGMNITERDTLLSEISGAKGSVKASGFLEALHLLKQVKLYDLSDEEKTVLNGLIDGMVLSADEEEARKYREQTLSYLKARNSCNRFIYFNFVYLNKAGRHKTIEWALANAEILEADIFENEPRLRIYKQGGKEQSILVLLAEFYRVKQMLAAEYQEPYALEIQMSAMKIFKLLNEKIPNYDLTLKLAGIGNPYHEDIIPAVEIGLGRLEGYCKNLVEGILLSNSEESPGSVEPSVEALMQELKMTFTYYPEEEQAVLENVARAIRDVRMLVAGGAQTIIIPGEGLEGNIRKFRKIFARYNPEQARRLVEMLKRGNLGKRRFAGVLEVLDLRDSNIDLKQEGPDYLRLCDLIKTDQAFRYHRLDAINQLAVAGETVNEEQIEFIFQQMKSPYEINCYIKSFLSEKAEKAQEKKQAIYSDIVLCAVRRLIELAEQSEEMKRQVIHVLTGLYYQLEVWSDEIVYAFDRVPELHRFLAEMYLTEDPIVAERASQYIKSCLKKKVKEEVGEEQAARNRQEICSLMMAGLLGKGGEFRFGRLIKLLEMCLMAAVNNEGVSLDATWQVLIDAYEGQVIEREVFDLIARNAEEYLEQYIFGGKYKEGVAERFIAIDEAGRDIFERALGEPAGAEIRVAGAAVEINKDRAKEDNQIIEWIESIISAEWRITIRGGEALDVALISGNFSVPEDEQREIRDFMEERLREALNKLLGRENFLPDIGGGITVRFHAGTYKDRRCTDLRLGRVREFLPHDTQEAVELHSRALYSSVLLQYGLRHELDHAWKRYGVGAAKTEEEDEERVRPNDRSFFETLELEEKTDLLSRLDRNNRNGVDVGGRVYSSLIAVLMKKYINRKGKVLADADRQRLKDVIYPVLQADYEAHRRMQDTNGFLYLQLLQYIIGRIEQRDPAAINEWIFSIEDYLAAFAGQLGIAIDGRKKMEVQKIHEQINNAMSCVGYISLADRCAIVQSYYDMKVIGRLGAPRSRRQRRRRPAADSGRRRPSDRADTRPDSAITEGEGRPQGEDETPTRPELDVPAEDDEGPEDGQGDFVYQPEEITEIVAGEKVYRYLDENNPIDLVSGDKLIRFVKTRKKLENGNMYGEEIVFLRYELHDRSKPVVRGVISEGGHKDVLSHVSLIIEGIGDIEEGRERKTQLTFENIAMEEKGIARICRRGEIFKAAEAVSDDEGMAVGLEMTPRQEREECEKGMREFMARMNYDEDYRQLDLDERAWRTNLRRRFGQEKSRLGRDLPRAERLDFSLRFNDYRVDQWIENLKLFREDILFLRKMNINLVLVWQRSDLQSDDEAAARFREEENRNFAAYVWKCVTMLRRIPAGLLRKCESPLQYVIDNRAMSALDFSPQIVGSKKMDDELLCVYELYRQLHLEKGLLPIEDFIRILNAANAGLWLLGEKGPGEGASELTDIVALLEDGIREGEDPLTLMRSICTVFFGVHSIFVTPADVIPFCLIDDQGAIQELGPDRVSQVREIALENMLRSEKPAAAMEFADPRQKRAADESA